MQKENIINPRELRIGSLINRKTRVSEDEDVFEAVAVDCYAELVHRIAKEPQLDTIYSAIPLTEKWLKDFGFENRTEYDSYYFTHGEFIIGGHGKKLFPSVHGESCLEAFGNEIQYVHQLQNLYFALTGEELTLKK